MALLQVLVVGIFVLNRHFKRRQVNSARLSFVNPNFSLSESNFPIQQVPPAIPVEIEHFYDVPPSDNTINSMFRGLRAMFRRPQPDQAVPPPEHIYEEIPLAEEPVPPEPALLPGHSVIVLSYHSSPEGSGESESLSPLWDPYNEIHDEIGSMFESQIEEELDNLPDVPLFDPSSTVGSPTRASSQDLGDPDELEASRDIEGGLSGDLDEDLMTLDESPIHLRMSSQSVYYRLL